MPASGMARYRDSVFRPFIRLYIHLYVRPATFTTTLASILLFRSVTLIPYEKLWQNMVQQKALSDNMAEQVS